jgi:hypothetical protein
MKASPSASLPPYSGQRGTDAAVITFVSIVCKLAVSSSVTCQWEEESDGRPDSRECGCRTHPNRQMLGRPWGPILAMAAQMLGTWVVSPPVISACARHITTRDGPFDCFERIIELGGSGDPVEIRGLNWVIPSRSMGRPFPWNESAGRHPPLQKF